MAVLTEPLQVATSRPITPPVPGLVLSQSDVLSTASAIIQTYPSITSAYLFGSYAKGTARPDSDIDIALFVPDLRWDKLADIGGVQIDLEAVLERQVDLSVCPPDDFVERIKRYWVPIDLHCSKPATQESDLLSSSSSSSRISEIPESSFTTTSISPRHDNLSTDSNPCATSNRGLTLTSIPRQSSLSPPPLQTPLEIGGEIALKIASRIANEEEPVKCREEDGSSLSQREPEQVHTAKRS